MSENIINRMNDIPVQQEKTIEQNSSCNRIKSDRVCVIITQKKQFLG